MHSEFCFDRDPNRDKIVPRSNHPTASGTYTCQGKNVLGYELQLLLSGVLRIFQNLNYKLQRRLSDDVLPITKVTKKKK